MKSNFNTIEWDLNHSIWRNRPSGNYRSPMPLSWANATLFRKYPSAQSRRVSDNPHFSHAESWWVENFSERLPLQVIHGELQFIDFSCLQQSSTRHFHDRVVWPREKLSQLATRHFEDFKSPFFSRCRYRIAVSTTRLDEKLENFLFSLVERSSRNLPLFFFQWLN